MLIDAPSALNSAPANKSEFPKPLKLINASVKGINKRIEPPAIPPRNIF